MCATVVVVLGAALFPGDSQFGGDEATLIRNAMSANARGALANMGLPGSFHYAYGPIPTQIYQLMLLLTHDLRTLVGVRAILVGGTIAASLWSLARTLRLPVGLVPIILASPWIVYFARTLWDNTFCLPVGCVLFAAYARWLVAPDRRVAFLCAVTATLLPLIHFFALPLTLAVTIHAIVSRARAIRSSLLPIAFGIALAVSSSVPYIRVVSAQLASEAARWLRGEHSQVTDQDTSRPSRWQSAGYTLRAATILTARQRFYQPVPRPRLLTAVGYLAMITCLVHGWAAVGTVMAVASQFRKEEQCTVREMAQLSLFALFAQAMMFALMRTDFFEHYFCGVFPAVVVLVWLGVARLWHDRVQRWLVIIPSAALVLASVFLAISIHQTAGDSGHYGPTISGRE